MARTENLIFAGNSGIYRSSFGVRRLAFAVLLALLLAVALVSIGTGAVAISPFETLAILSRRVGFETPFAFTAQQESVLLYIRLPRVLLGLAIGAGLAVSGAVLQSLFRNPLADPGLIGVSGGAAAAVATAIVLGENLFGQISEFGKSISLPAAAFVGGLGTTILVYRIGKRRGGGAADVAALLLAGIAVNALAGAGIGLMSFLANDAQLRNIAFWNLGSVGAANWTTLAVSTPLILLSIGLLLRLARPLNAILLGEAEAVHLGFDVERLKRQAIFLVALCVGASVSAAGAIGFIGLVAPHLLRLTTGADYRRLLKNSALLGAILILSADTLARTIVAPAELPLGIVTAFIGAPFFVWLLLRQKQI
jgi:iron complex transport system permease protein